MKKLNYLVVTDIHFNLNYLNYLKEKTPTNIDGILILGDLVNANHQKPFTEPVKDIEEFEQVLALAKSIHPKVFYIPGNHDPEIYFNKGNKTTSGDEYPINLHKEVHRLDDNLVLIGLGGSVDSFLRHNTDKLVWRGYPYESEEAYEKDLNKLFDPILNSNSGDSKEGENLIKEGDSILLLTHTGPIEVDTTQIISNPDIRQRTEIASGSNALYNFLISPIIQKLAFPSNPLRPNKQYPILTSKIPGKSDKRIRNHLVANLHGHSHAGWGMVGNLGGHLPVINPGSLQDGKYLNIELSEINPIPDCGDEHEVLLSRVWTLTGVEFKTIW